MPSGPGQLRKEQWRGRLLRGLSADPRGQSRPRQPLLAALTPHRAGAGGLLRHCRSRPARPNSRPDRVGAGSLSMEPAWIAPCRADSARWSASSGHVEPAGLRAPVMSNPAISIVIPTFNNVDVLRQCVDGWRQHGGPDVELVVVEDGCVDSTPSYLDEVSATPGASGSCDGFTKRTRTSCDARIAASRQRAARSSWPGRTTCSCAPAGWCRSWCGRSPRTTISG